MSTVGMAAHLFRGDLDAEFLAWCQDSQIVAWDIETAGLDWRHDALATCQIATLEDVAVVQLPQGAVPQRLARLLEDARVRKVFHHAPFDLRFMTFQWAASPRNVACTKVASKILEPDLPAEEHSLMPTLRRRLGITISKDQQRSDWLKDRLTEAQLEYAAADVRHLVPLLEVELDNAARLGLRDEIEASFAYLPVRARLDIRGCGDVFSY